MPPCRPIRASLALLPALLPALLLAPHLAPPPAAAQGAPRGALVPAAYAAPESTWADHNRAAAAARERGDWAGYRAHLARTRALLGDHPTLLVGLARAHARLGAGDSAAALLARYAAMGLALPDAGADSAWAPLRARPDWPALAARLAAAPGAAGRARVTWTLADSTLMPEGVAVDARSGRTFVSSIRHGTVLVRDGIGARTFVRPPEAGHWWSLLGLAVDRARGLLWAGTAALPHFAGGGPADSGRTALLAFDLNTGAPRHRVELPPDGRRHTFGDVALLRDGTVLAADADGGALYALEPRARALRALTAPGALPSPQGAAEAADGRRVYVADYLRGVVAVDRRTGGVTPLAGPDTLTTVGVDGLARVGNVLVAVQNGTRPQRVLRLELDDAGSRVVAWRVLAAGAPTLDEPTHVAPTPDGDVLVVANSGWNRFTPAGVLREGAALEPGRVLRIPLH